MAIEDMGDTVAYSDGSGRQQAVGVVVLRDAGGGSGGSGQVEVTNFPATQAVTGPITNAQDSAKTGTASAAAYSDDTGAADGTVIALLKGIYVQNAAIIALLTSIDSKTPAA